MASQNVISATLSEGDKHDILQKLADIKSRWPVPPLTG
jgi:hypothetical protein